MSDLDRELFNSLELFQDEIDSYDNLEIVCTEEKDGKDILVIQDNSMPEDIEGHQITVEVSEIFGKVKDKDSAEAFVKVINRDRPSIVLNGVTRIVGYYSRVNNWNKSKVGELRDRQNGNYGTGKYAFKHKKEAMVAVDNL